jgi:zinc/manganese transport system ATP-binding protein
VAALIRRVCREQHVAVMLVAHDINPIISYLDRVVYLAGGGAVEGRPDDVISSETLSRLYGAPIEVLQASDGRLVVVGQPEAPFVHGDRHAHAH